MTWTAHRLPAIAELSLGKMLDQKKNRGELRPYLANVNVRWGSFDLTDLREMRFEPHESERYGLRSGDIVMCEGGEPGRCSLWRDDVPGVMLQKALHRIRPRTGVEPRFLFYSLFAQGRAGMLERLFTGATIKHLPSEQLAKVEVALPPLAVQRRIASILGAYDDLIEVNRRRIAVLEEMARRLFEEWFVHLRFPGHNEVALQADQVKLPEGWSVKTISGVCSSLQAGSTPSRKQPEYWTDGVVDWFTTGELQDCFLLSSKERVSRIAVQDRKARLFPAGTIFMAIYGSPTVGRVGIATRECSSNQAALALWPDEQRIGRWFLVHMLIGLRQHFNSISQGAAQQNISKEKVAATKFACPPPVLIKLFECRVSAIWELRRTLESQQSKLAESRDLLLPRLVSGEISVSTAERELEAIA